MVKLDKPVPRTEAEPFLQQVLNSNTFLLPGVEAVRCREILKILFDLYQPSGTPLIRAVEVAQRLGPKLDGEKSAARDKSTGAVRTAASKPRELLEEYYKEEAQNAAVRFKLPIPPRRRGYRLDISYWTPESSVALINDSTRVEALAAASEATREKLSDAASADEAVAEPTGVGGLPPAEHEPPFERASPLIFDPRCHTSLHLKPAPYPETQLFWETFDVGRRLDGGAVEIRANFNLTHGLPLARTGWSPDDVRLRKLEENFDAQKILADKEFIAAFEESEKVREKKGKSRIQDPITGSPLTRNGTKYVLVRASPNVDERDDLTIALQQTDYLTIMQAMPGLAKYPEKRRLYGNAEPTLNLVPNSLGVQFIALFADSHVLAVLRDDDLDYDASTWGISGEEQLKDTDVAVEDRLRTKRFLLRAVAEEVFPLAGARDESELQRRLDYIAPTVRSMRIWSVFVQEPVVSFVLFAVFELGLTIEDYRQLVEGLRLNGCQTSGEGRYHAITLPDAVRLLEGQTINAKSLRGTGTTPLRPNALHPTSRYRLGLLLEVLSGVTR